MSTASTKTSIHKPVAKASDSSAKPSSRGKSKAAKPSADPASQREPDRASPRVADIDEDVLEFIAAIDNFKLVNARPFPSWSEILQVVRQLGYERK